MEGGVSLYNSLTLQSSRWLLQFTAVPGVVSSEQRALRTTPESPELASHITHSSHFSFSFYCSVRLTLAESFTAPSETQSFYFSAKAWRCIFSALLFNPSQPQKWLQWTYSSKWSRTRPCKLFNWVDPLREFLHYFSCTEQNFYPDFLKNAPLP